MGQLSINRDGLKTREELVTDAIRQAILRGQFRPGDKLDQQDLANELGVGRSPIREALRTLGAEELVTHFPHRGAMVTERSVNELQELLFIRTTLEGAAARRAAECMGDDRLEALQAILAEADQTDDLQRILELNNLFHATIYAAYEQPYLVELIQSLRNKVAPYNRLYLDLDYTREQAWEDHRRIYEACVARDGAGAERETCRHLEQVFEGISRSIESAEEGIKNGHR